MLDSERAEDLRAESREDFTLMAWVVLLMRRRAMAAELYIYFIF